MLPVIAGQSAMSTPLSFKRRRLDNAHNKLSKPFVSPMRRQSIARVGDSHRDKDDSSSERISKDRDLDIANGVVDALHGKPSTHGLHNNDASPWRKSEATSYSNVSRVGTGSATRAELGEVVIQKQITALGRQIRQLRSDVDTLEQAIRITTTAADEKINSLFVKWRIASQHLAEVVFDDAKLRVNNEGGMAAMRAKEHERREDQVRFNLDEMGSKNNARSRSEASVDESPGASNLSASDALKMVDEETGWAECRTKHEADSEDIFNMKLMLQSLNIPADLIGYNEQDDTWFSAG